MMTQEIVDTVDVSDICQDIDVDDRIIFEPLPSYDRDVSF